MPIAAETSEEKSIQGLRAELQFVQAEIEKLKKKQFGSEIKDSYVRSNQVKSLEQKERELKDQLGI